MQSENFAGIHERHVGVLIPSVMWNKRVLLLGAGSLGSLIANFLVRAGIGTIEVYDNERVDVANLSRTAYRRADIGRDKVLALHDLLIEIRGDANVDTKCRDIHAMEDSELTAAIERADIVIPATDHPTTQARAAALSYGRKPTLIPGVYERGVGGEVVFTLPDRTACWHCVFAGIRTEEQPDRGQPDYGVATGQLRAVPALGTDIATVAVAAAKIAIALLHVGTGHELERMLRPDRNILFLGNSIDWAFTDYAENFWAKTIRRPDCPVCSEDGTS